MIIDQLPEISSVQDTDELPIERGTTTYKTPLSKIWDRLAAAFASSSTPNMDGTAAAGTSDKYSRSDHVHPSDTSKQDTISASGMLKGTGSAVQAATKGTDYGALSFTVTLAAASWSSNAQTVSNANFLATGYAFMVSPESSSFADYAAAVIYADDVTTDGGMTFHCGTTPTADLTVNIVRVVSA